MSAEEKRRNAEREMKKWSFKDNGEVVSIKLEIPEGKVVSRRPEETDLIVKYSQNRLFVQWRGEEEPLIDVSYLFFFFLYKNNRLTRQNKCKGELEHKIVIIEKGSLSFSHQDCLTREYKAEKKGVWKAYVDLEKANEKSVWSFLYSENAVRERAEKGDLICQVRVALKKLSQGEDDEAIRLFTLSGEKGHCSSCCSLGDLYYKKYINSKESEEKNKYLSFCVQWYCKAGGVGIDLFEESDTKRSAKALYQLASFKSQKKSDSGNLLEGLDRIELLKLASSCPTSEDDNKEYVQLAARWLNTHFSRLWTKTGDERYKMEATKYAKIGNMIKEVKPTDSKLHKVSFDPGSPADPPKKSNLWKYVAVGAGILTVATFIIISFYGTPSPKQDTSRNEGGDKKGGKKIAVKY